MPELPEVETIKNGLALHIRGLEFTAVRIFDQRPIQDMGLDDFCTGITGTKILDLKRKGKYLIIKLSSGDYLVIHLRMTGSLLWEPCGPEPYTRIEFTMNNGGKLVLSDVRRFCTVNLTLHPEKLLKKLGVEPLSRRFTPALLEKLFDRRTAPVKSVLLMQELIAGIGNMYSDEALFLARIHPQRRASSLTGGEIVSLHKAIIDVLEKGIRNKGASVRNYRCANGESGRAHEEFAVAHRKGGKCPRCGGVIARMVIGQRGTFYCPHCQHQPKV